MSTYVSNFCTINCATTTTHAVPDVCAKIVRASCPNRLISIECPTTLAQLLLLRGVPFNSATSINTPAAIAAQLNTLASGGATAKAIALEGELEALPENTYNTIQVSGCKSMDILGETSMTFTVRATWDHIAATATTPHRDGLTYMRDYYLLNQAKISAWAFVDCDNNVFAFMNPSASNTPTSLNPADYFAKGTVTADIIQEKVGTECIDVLKITVKFPRGAAKSQPLLNITQHPTATVIYNAWQTS